MLDASAIRSDVAEARGYRTITSKAEIVRLGFADYQARTPALLIPIHDVHGNIRQYLLRPDDPRMDKGKGKPIKYEIPKGAGMLIDIPPFVRPQLGDPGAPLWITEGSRKADAAASIGLACIDVIGVWNWRGTNGEGGTTALGDWEAIAFNGRTAYLAFDSDAWRKPQVHSALKRLAAFLKTRGAHIQIVYLPDAPDGAKMGLDDYLATGKTRDDLLALADSSIRTITEPDAVDAMIDDAPQPGLYVPDGFRLDASGTYRVGRDEQGDEVLRPIAPTPILITERFRDVDDGAEALQLAWKRASGWHTYTADRDVAMDARKLPGLARVGFPVGSENAKGLASYLYHAEARNDGNLPTHHIAGHLGWQGEDGRLGFLWGRELIGPDAGAVTFRGRDAGDDQAIGGFHASGTMEGWRAAVAPLKDFPRALLAFYTAFVPPLLEMLAVPNFTLDISNRTSTGKTTALRAAASAWGRPDERAADGALATFDATVVGIERRAAILSGLPLILDETQRAKDQARLGDLVYAIASGQGRTRGSVQGMALTRTFRTVMMSTGEAPITSFGQQGGTRTRVLQVRGMPFGRQDAPRRAVVTAMDQGIRANYGHAGPAFVRYLQAHPDELDFWRGMASTRAQLYANAGKTPEAGRLADFAAAITVASYIAHQALSLPWDWDDPVVPLWEEIAGEAADASGEVRALADTYSWAMSNQARFHGRLDTDERGNERTPAAGIAGRWEPGADWPFIAFHPPILKKVLTEGGYNPDAILAGWREQGWLETEDDDKKRYTKRVRMGGERAHLVVIRREALEGGNQE
jgi:hypothetical protein